MMKNRTMLTMLIWLYAVILITGTTLFLWLVRALG